MIRVERHGPVELLTLDRPAKSNALHPELIGSLAGELARAGRDADLRAVVLTGAGRSFCAGLDLHHLAGSDADARVGYMRSAFDLFRQVHELRQPVIAAVNGPAMAGGFDLAAFSDIRLCSPEARFAQTEILLGLTQIPYPVYEAIGLGRARELALTGRAIGADEAHRIGLVSAVHAREELLPAALGLARELAGRPPEALFETKRLSRELLEPDLDAAMARTFGAIERRLRSEEHRAAVESYLARLAARRGGGGTASEARPGAPSRSREEE